MTRRIPLMPNQRSSSALPANWHLDQEKGSRYGHAAPGAYALRHQHGTRSASWAAASILVDALFMRVAPCNQGHPNAIAE